MIALFFLAFPFYRALCRYPRTLLTTTIIFGGITSFVGRPQFDGPTLDNFLAFQPAYLLGMTCCVYREDMRQWISALLPLLLLCLLILTGIETQGLREQFEAPSMLLLTVFLIPLFKAESPLNPIWEWLASRSFAIFFLHGIFIHRIERFTDTMHVFPALMLGIGLTFACGLLVDAARLTLGPKSRFVVGA